MRFYPLVHSSSACNGQSWERQAKTGSQEPNSGLPDGWWGPNYWLPPRVHVSSKLESELRADFKYGHLNPKQCRNHSQTSILTFYDIYPVLLKGPTVLEHPSPISSIALQTNGWTFQFTLIPPTHTHTHTSLNLSISFLLRLVQ